MRWLGVGSEARGQQQWQCPPALSLEHLSGSETGPLPSSLGSRPRLSYLLSFHKNASYYKSAVTIFAFLFFSYQEIQ